MWKVIVFVVLMGNNPSMSDVQHAAQIPDERDSINKVSCDERAPEFIAELNETYKSMKPKYAYACVYLGEMV